jgi:predicted molibdopterin-dependent oxidoreductase YjgC
VIQIIIDGTELRAAAGDRLIDTINRAGLALPQVCYHPQLGPIQTCGTCIVEVNSELVRACATGVAAGMKVSAGSARAQAARTEAFNRILRNHERYCTVCDNNNGNCTVHNTTKLLGLDHQSYPFAGIREARRRPEDSASGTRREKQSRSRRSPVIRMSPPHQPTLSASSRQAVTSAPDPNPATAKPVIKPRLSGNHLTSVAMGMM